MVIRKPKFVAYVFEDVGGWFVCPDRKTLDTRGRCFESKAQAIAAVRERALRGHTDYTHYRTGDTKPRKLA